MSQMQLILLSLKFQINNRFFLLTFFSFVLVSCTKEIIIPIPSIESNYVIRSEFTHLPEEEPPGPGVIPSFTFPGKLTVSKSAHIFDTPIDSIDFIKILLFKNQNFIDTISFDYTKGYYDLFQSQANYPTFNDELTIQLITPNQSNISASSYIPSEIQIDSVVNTVNAYYTDIGGIMSEAIFYFKDDPSTTNYYEITISRNNLIDGEPIYRPIETNESFITSEPHYPSVLQLNSTVQINESILFSDKSFNGQSKSISVYYMPGYTSLDSIYYLNQTSVFQLRNVSKEYYDFKTSKRTQLISNQEDILYGASEPSPVKSNIVNGLGLFGGFSYAQKVFFFPNQTFPLQ